jgi:hypothetical protein
VITRIARGSAQSHTVVREESTLKRRQVIRKSSKVFVGMDVHKETIDITLAEGSGEVRRWGQIGGDRAALEKGVRKLEALGKMFHFVCPLGQTS